MTTSGVFCIYKANRGMPCHTKAKLYYTTYKASLYPVTV